MSNALITTPAESAGAAAILKQVREDVANGAELDDVLECLREASLGNALGELLGEVANAEEEQNGTQSSGPLWSAVIKAREIDRTVAHREV